MKTSQIREQERKKLAEQFNRKFEFLIRDLETYKKMYRRVLAQNGELTHELSEIKIANEELTEKVNQYEDWIHRLQSFMDLPDSERKEAYKQYVAEREKSYKLNHLLGVYEQIFHTIF